ncbi:Gypsy retrotransposon integrase-like protein 1 [Stygiomarasmius scandens]|uniref:Gypsy retrotransposon integrase-like protein 1 n=1 Tax=Marasmiellus scandens TaxID=2682957 RepID=A0ABR1KCB4_9AGAR
MSNPLTSKLPSSSSRARRQAHNNFLYAEPTGGFKKRRLGRACDLCRQKRIRCDSVKMPGYVCSSCISFNVECTHRGMTTKDTYAPVSMQSLVEEIINSSTPYPTPEDKDVVQKMVMDLAKYARNLEKRIYGLVQYLSKMNTHTLDVLPSDEDEDRVGRLADFLGTVSVSKPEKRFFGKSSMISLWKLTLEMERNRRLEETQESEDDDTTDVEAVATPEFLTIYPPAKSCMDSSSHYTFPEHSLILSLTDTYFKRMSVTFPFLHRPTFERKLAEGLYLHDQDFGALVLSVCACGASGSADPRLNNDNLEVIAGSEWHSQLKLRQFDCLKPISLYELQTVINSLLFTPFWLPNWMTLCNTIRLAQEVGIHRRDWYDRQEMSAADKELWKRAFWALVFYDVYLADYFGRTGNLAPEDYDLEPPCNCDDQYWPEESSNPDQAFNQPQGKPSLMAYWLISLDLAIIYRYGQRTIYAARRPQFIMGENPTWKQKVVSQLDAAMNRWVDKIPMHLRWNLSTGFGIQDGESPERRRMFDAQTAGVYTTFYFMQIQIHRPLVSKLDGKNSLSLESHAHLAVCVSAARSCIHLLHVYSQKYETPPFGHVFVQILRTSLILVLNISIAKANKLLSNDHKTDMDYLLKCVDILRRFQGRWQVTRRCIDTIQGLIDRCSTSDGSISRSGAADNGSSSSTAGSGPSNVMIPEHQNSYAEDRHSEGTIDSLFSFQNSSVSYWNTSHYPNTQGGTTNSNHPFSAQPSHFHLPQSDPQLPSSAYPSALYQGSGTNAFENPDAVDLALDWVHQAFTASGDGRAYPESEQAQIDQILNNQPMAFLDQSNPFAWLENWQKS